MPHPPTPEQSAILDAVTSTKANLMIVARAGCGKTTMLEMIDRAERKLPYLLMCFNKSIATEAQARMRSATMVKTFNSLGHGIWSNYFGKRLILNQKKILEIYRSIVESAPRGERQFIWSLYDSVVVAVNLGRNLGYIPDDHIHTSKRLINFPTLERHLDETLVGEARGLIDKVLSIAIAKSYEGIIDFTDQVYMPSLFAGTYPTFPTVMIDEYQDLSPINRAMVAKLCKQSRQIGVGDEAQAIYEFRGADANAMADAIAQFDMATLPLSTSFRCPSNITNNVHWRVPDIRSTRIGGNVSHGTKDSIIPNSTIICRYNAPLLHLAMIMFVAGHKVDVAGIDIGTRILRQLTKLGPDTMTQAQTIHAIDDWLAEKESLDSKSAADTAECMKVFARRGQTLAQAIAYAKHIFEQPGGEIKFMSGHRSKGLEFDHVYHLDSQRIGKHGQDPNIHYVIDTRPKESLTYIQS